MLKKFLADSLTKCKVPKMETQIRKYTTHMVTMSWRNNIVSMETGVYVMRHMETYFGEREKEWECGFNAKGGKSLDMLRIKFAKTLLICAHNTRGAINQAVATWHWKGKPTKFNFDKWVDQYGLD
ncbi:uncharacterized protein LOC121789504 [Salvia splendens]|uniref:uncharacterized protein LOC121789504 n=1 Tax=Salvia splendens TaxID=180675 RepID=UPI001C26EF76|nr:uncharacterized protein LOC121789504 [Salvia splendens]